jgi:hypothetical protein
MLNYYLNLAKENGWDCFGYNVPPLNSKITIMENNILNINTYNNNTFLCVFEKSLPELVCNKSFIKALCDTDKHECGINERKMLRDLTQYIYDNKYPTCDGLAKEIRETLR